MYQFIIENCLKGICDAVILEKGNVSQEEFSHMRNIISEVNDPENILTTTRRTFDWEDLETILKKKHNRYSLLYGKYFYGFEREARSAYYSENAVQGAYFLFKTPLREDLLERSVHLAFCNPVDDPKTLVPKEERKCDFVKYEDSYDMEGEEEEYESTVESASEKIERK
jgi:hypothetical protein